MEVTQKAEPRSISMAGAQRKLIEEQKLKDLKVKNYLFQVIDRNVMETILNRDTSKGIWDSMKHRSTKAQLR